MDPYDGLPPEQPIEGDPVADENKKLPAKAEKKKHEPIPLDETGLPAPKTMEQLWRVATLLAKSKMVPKDYMAGYDDQSVEAAAQKIMVAHFLGRELGLTLMSSLRSIAVINGRPSVWGDAVPALVHRMGNIEWVKEYFKGSGDSLTAVCEVQKKGYPEPFIGTFSVEDAKKAQLWGGGPRGKKETWIKYPRRMLKMRAREAYRDAEPGALMGMLFAEVAQDLPPVDVTPPADKTVQPESPPAEPEVMEAELGDALAGEKPAAQPSFTPQAGIITDPDGFNWLPKFLENPLVVELTTVQTELLKLFITEAGKEFEADVLEVQKQALQNFDSFWRQFEFYHSREKKAGKIDALQAEMDAVVAASRPEPESENYWMNRNKWKFLGGENFKRAVEQHLEELAAMPAEFIAEIRDRWENKIELDLGPFPLATKSKPDQKTDKLSELRNELAFFETNHEAVWLEARKALGISMSNDKLDIDECDQLLSQIDLIMQDQGGKGGQGKF